MSRTRQLITLFLITAVAVIAFVALLNILEDNKRDISEVGVGGGGGGGVGETSDSTNTIGDSNVKETIEGTGAEKNREEGREEDQALIASNEQLNEFKGKGDKYTQNLQSASELQKKFPKKGEPLPRIFEKQVEKIEGVSRNGYEKLFYSDLQLQQKIAAALRQQDYDVGIDPAGNIIGRTVKYQIMIHHIK